MKCSRDLVDFHSHILPNADHGSSSVETSLYQLDLARSFGVTRIIATPHFYPHVHSVAAFLEKRDRAYDTLLSHLENSKMIRLGAEVLICNGIERLPQLDKLFIRGTNVLLLELPDTDFQTEYCRTVENLVNSGVEVVIAHADRYPVENIERMLEAGANLQLNAEALSTIFTRPHLYNWLENNRVVALGSDIHGRDKNAYRRFAKAIEKISHNLDFIKIKSDEVWEQSY